MAVLFRRPVREVAQWPAWELDLIDHYLTRQPAAEERLEVAVATLVAIYVNAHLKEGAAQRTALDFMPFADPWPQPKAQRYSELDLEVMQAFGVKQ